MARFVMTKKLTNATGALLVIPAQAKFLFRGVIHGDYVSMKNGRRIVTFGNRFGCIKKQKALDWEQLAVLQVPRPKTPFLGLCALMADFHYARKASDLDENLLKDMLQVKKPGKPCCGVIFNDNQIKIHDTRWHLDKLNPRVEFLLMDLASYDRLRKDKPDTL
jgi:hypothetical protein